MQILDAKVMKVQKMLIVHCYKHYEKNTCNGFAISFCLCFTHIECNYLVEILDAKVVKAQNTCLLC
jgi:hypothetical protein